MSPRARKASAAAQAWNESRTYRPGGRPQQAHVPLTTTCHTEGCGIAEDVLDEGDPTVWAWILVRVNGSAESGRWYCSAACAHHGLALAQLRMRPDGGAAC